MVLRGSHVDVLYGPQGLPEPARLGYPDPLPDSARVAELADAPA